MLIPKYFVTLQIIGTVCIHSSPNKDLKNCCPPSEVADTDTHCHILNFHCTRLLTDVCLLWFSHCLSLYVYIMRLCVFLCILRIVYFVLWTIVILCAFDTRFIKCNLLACLLENNTTIAERVVKCRIVLIQFNVWFLRHIPGRGHITQNRVRLLPPYVCLWTLKLSVPFED